MGLACPSTIAPTVSPRQNSHGPSRKANLAPFPGQAFKDDVSDQVSMGKTLPPIEDWVEEYVAGLATAAVRGKNPVSWAVKTLKEYDRDYLNMVLHEREGFLILPMRDDIGNLGRHLVWKFKRLDGERIKQESHQPRPRPICPCPDSQSREPPSLQDLCRLPESRRRIRRG